MTMISEKTVVRLTAADGSTLETKIRKMRRYIAVRRDDFESEQEWRKWGEKSAEQLLQNLAQHVTIEAQHVTIEDD